MLPPDRGTTPVEGRKAANSQRQGLNRLGSLESSPTLQKRVNPSSESERKDERRLKRGHLERVRRKRKRSTRLGPGRKMPESRARTRGYELRLCRSVRSRGPGSGKSVWKTSIAYGKNTSLVSRNLNYKGTAKQKRRKKRD